MEEHISFLSDNLKIDGFYSKGSGEKGVVIKTLDMSDPERTSAFDSLITAITGQWLVDCLINGKIASIEPEYLRKL